MEHAVCSSGQLPPAAAWSSLRGTVRACGLRGVGGHGGGCGDCLLHRLRQGKEEARLGVQHVVSGIRNWELRHRALKKKGFKNNFDTRICVCKKLGVQENEGY